MANEIANGMANEIANEISNGIDEKIKILSQINMYVCRGFTTSKNISAECDILELKFELELLKHKELERNDNITLNYITKIYELTKILFEGQKN